MEQEALFRYFLLFTDIESFPPILFRLLALAFFTLTFVLSVAVRDRKHKIENG